MLICQSLSSITLDFSIFFKISFVANQQSKLKLPINIVLVVFDKLFKNFDKRLLYCYIIDNKKANYLIHLGYFCRVYNEINDIVDILDLITQSNSVFSGWYIEFLKENSNIYLIDHLELSERS